MQSSFQLPLFIGWFLSLVVPCSVLAASQTTNQHLVPLKITANKIEESSLDVPQAVSVMEEYDIEDKGIQQVTDIVNEIPNMSLQTNGGSRISFRGLSASLFTNNNPVVVYIDGVPSTDYNDFDASLANVERVEVLRGPQGTLYGKDAIGAVINIVTKAPTNNWQGKVAAQAGSYQQRFGSFSSSGALIKNTLFVGMNGQTQAEDGWIDNTYPGADKEANKKHSSKLAGYLLYTPSAALKMKLNLQHRRRTQYWWDAYGLPSGTPLSEFHRDDAQAVAYDVPQKESINTDAQSLQVHYRFNHMDFESTTVHRKMTMAGLYDADFGVTDAYAGLAQFNQNETNAWSQELKLSSNQGDGIRWVGGLYVDQEKRQQAPSGAEFPFYVDADNDGIAETFVGNYRMNSESQTKGTTLAMFAQLMVPVDDLWELTLGARWQHIKKSIDLATYYLPKGQAGDPSYQLSAEHSWHTVLPRVALSYQLDSDWMMYGSYSEGYMPGGYNYYANQGREQDNRFNAQTSSNYELGIKGMTDNVTLSANLFYMAIRGLHVYKEMGGLYLTSNAEKAHSQGAEIEANWFVGENIQLSTALGVTQAKYDKYHTGNRRYDGQHLIKTPSHTIRLSLAYDPGDAWYGRLDAKYQGAAYFFDDANDVLTRQSGFRVFDLRAGYRQDAWNLYWYVKNITDEKYIRGFISNSLVSVATFGEPRTLGLGAFYSF